MNYDPASYPRGVPSPYGPRVHAWNEGPYAAGTRYHGSVWIRPDYRLPWANRPFAGLGGSSLPWQCWDVPGFKDCHGEAWSQAYSWCTAPQSDGKQWWQANAGSLEDCITVNTDQRAMQTCVPRYCAKFATQARQGSLVSNNPNLPWILAGAAGLGLVLAASYMRR